MVMKAQIELVLGDITELDVDALVNAANNTLLGGGGVDGAIHRKAGKELLAECRPLNGCETGQAKITKGYNLKARHVIHTVGPVWHGGEKNEAQLLASAYHESLKLAEANGLKSVAFPCISTGVYHFPDEQAAVIALNTIESFDFQSVEKIILCCFLQKDFDIYHKLLNPDNNKSDNNGVEQVQTKE
jgi:O-acetyl-ADP-ribose deacetylase